VWLGFPEIKVLLQWVFADGSWLREMSSSVRPEQQYARNYETRNLLTLGHWLERQGVAIS